MLVPPVQVSQQLPSYTRSCSPMLQDSEEVEPDNAMEILTRSRKHLSKKSTSILREFLQTHWSNPYPTQTEREELRQQTGLTITQINNWFTNARRRIWRPSLKKSLNKKKESQEVSMTDSIHVENLKRASSFELAQAPSSSFIHAKSLSAPHITYDEPIQLYQGISRDITLPAIMSEPAHESQFKLPSVEHILTSAPKLDNVKSMIEAEGPHSKIAIKEPAQMDFESVKKEPPSPVMDVANILASLGTKMH
jgi:hypothetical protein